MANTKPRTDEQRRLLSERMRTSAAVAAARERRRGIRYRLSDVTRARMSASKRYPKGSPAWDLACAAYLRRLEDERRFQEELAAVSEDAPDNPDATTRIA